MPTASLHWILISMLPHITGDYHVYFNSTHCSRSFSFSINNIFNIEKSNVYFCLEIFCVDPANYLVKRTGLLRKIILGLNIKPITIICNPQPKALLWLWAQLTRFLILVIRIEKKRINKYWSWVFCTLSNRNCTEVSTYHIKLINFSSNIFEKLTEQNLRIRVRKSTNLKMVVSTLSICQSFIAKRTSGQSSSV